MKNNPKNLKLFNLEWKSNSLPVESQARNVVFLNISKNSVVYLIIYLPCKYILLLMYNLFESIGKAETMPAGEKNTSDHDNVKKSSPNDGDPAGKTSNSESKDFCPDYIPDESCSPCISESESKENVSVLGAGIEGQASIQKHGFMSTSSMPGKDFVVSLPAAEFDDLSCDCVGECDCDCYECLLCNKDPGAGYSETASMGIADEEAEAFVKSSPAGVNAKKQSVKTNQQGSSRMTNGNFVKFLFGFFRKSCLDFKNNGHIY